MKQVSYLIISAFLIGLYSCNQNKKPELTQEQKDSIQTAKEDSIQKAKEDSIRVENNENVHEAQPTGPTISSWTDVAKLLGKSYKIIGVWRDSYGVNLMIYSHKGKYYKAQVEMTENPINENSSERIKKKSSKVYMFTQAGYDMPEKYIINGNQLDFYVYNPDGPYGAEWVFMGNYNKVY